MFPWSDSCLFKRLKRQRRLSQKEEELLELWKTEVCSGGELPEVEIVSLLEEQIPKYTLRADTLTEFTGYENQDWFIPCPALKPEDADVSVLSPDTIRETLNYFLLCSNRVSQMSKTYNDIEAVTRLLEEKEKDIELTARIGKELLTNNQKLESTVSNLESELRIANEKITQLQHELTKKTELIQILTNDVEETGSEVSTPTGAVNLDMLQRRIGKLEEENVQLRNEASFLAEQTDEVEQQEQKLVSDFISQLASAKYDLSSITEEAEKFREESRVFKRLSDNLQDKLQQTEQKLLKSKNENEELTALLVVTRESQNELALELSDLKERYAEVLDLLQETQESLKQQKKKGVPTVRGGGLFSSMQSSMVSSHHPDSLSTELECSLFSELSLDSGISSDRTSHYKKVFETVRSASKNSSLGSASPAQLNSYHVKSSYDSSSSIMSFDSHSNKVVKRNRNIYTVSSSQRSSIGSDDFSASDSECSDDFAYPGGPKEGIPGAPGSADLAEAIRRLTPAAVYARRAALSSGTFAGALYDSECRTPDSIMSTSCFSGDTFGHAPWKLPDKLQIVKPLEGSQTLHHWSQLATPSLSGLLEERPGIKTRGGAELEDLGLHLYSLTDVEEDEEVVHPGKSFQQSGHIYTFTNSTVMHPDDGTSLTSSVLGSRMSTVSNSAASTQPGTPARLSRRNSTCTFSVTLGLAKLLNERGIVAATPSALVTPAFTATATPCNSPDAGSPASTPCHSRSVSPAPFVSAFGLPGFLMSSGAEYLRRTLTGGLLDPVTHSSRSKETRADAVVAKTDKKALTGIRLVETVEKLGLETLISTSANEENSEGNSGSGNDGRSRSARRGAKVTKKSDTKSKTSTKARGGARAVRPDLGTVLGSVPTTTAVNKGNTPSQTTSTLGTLSSLLFGRKGGLL